MPKATQDTSTGSVKMQLLDSQFKPITWGKGPNSVSQVNATVGEPCQPTQSCSQVFTSSSMKDYMLLSVPTGRLATIALEVMYGQSKECVKLPPVITKIECNEETTPLIRVIVPPLGKIPPASETATLMIQGHFCSQKEGNRERIRSVEIEKPTVKTICYQKNGAGPLIPADGDADAPIAQVTMMQGSAALVTLALHATYEITVNSREECSRACTSMPVWLDVCSVFELSWDICFERAEPSAALFFVDRCNQPVALSDVYPRGQAQPLAVTANGQAWLTGEGPLKLSSPTYELFPDEIPVRGDRTEAHVVRALPRKSSGQGKTPGKNECILVFPDLKPNSKATVTVMKLNGERITTLTAENGEVTYTPEDPNEVLEYVASIDDVVYDTVKMKAV